MAVRRRVNGAVHDADDVVVGEDTERGVEGDDGAQPLTAAALRRERMRDEIRESILVATRDIVQREGIDGFSLRGVARAVGYSPAAIYEYFTSKDELLDCLYFAGNGGLADQMMRVLREAPVDQSVAETVKDLGRTYRRHALSQPELYRFIFGHVHDSTPHHGKTWRMPKSEDEAEPGDAFALLVETVGRGIERGEFVPMPPIALAVAAWALVHGFVTIELSGALDDARPASLAIRQETDETTAADAGPNHDLLFEGVLSLLGTGLMRRTATEGVE
ncbi:MAG: hypothetical protein AVDCRST_MAG70-574 [uncultured Thermomicrobiales bacterium]|uniref:HTH tetR-type domain-containing protein n=1 Tax=uncultured Thermomicrobiales bacterium TaxID=1645740 RepID=A0A6J4UC29_9BACT|nr:MAG: hypothetical protein AVDCRST_MAG70-574 [uncultured Thermomicrobiales bacterium]